MRAPERPLARAGPSLDAKQPTDRSMRCPARAHERAQCAKRVERGARVQVERMCDLRAVLVALYHGVPSLHFVFQVRATSLSTASHTVLWLA